MQKAFKILNSVYVFASLIGTMLFLFGEGFLILNKANLFVFFIPLSLVFISLLLLFVFDNTDSGFFANLIPWSIVLLFDVLILWSLFIYLKKNKFLMIFIMYITDIAALFLFCDFDVFSYSVALRLIIKLIFLGVLIAHFVIHRKNIKANLP